MMRKMFVTLSLLALALTISTEDAFARGGRRGGRGGCGGCGDVGYAGGCGGGYAGGCGSIGGYGMIGGCGSIGGYGMIGGCGSIGGYGMIGDAYHGMHAGYAMPGVMHAGLELPATDLRQSFYAGPGDQQTAGFMVLVGNADAEIWIDDTPTRQRGMQRVFQTPPLTGNASYTLKARWNENGQMVERQQQLQVQPGRMANVDFRAAPTTQPRTSD